MAATCARFIAIQRQNTPRRHIPTPTSLAHPSIARQKSIHFQALRAQEVPMHIGTILQATVNVFAARIQMVITRSTTWITAVVQTQDWLPRLVAIAVAVVVTFAGPPGVAVSQGSS